MAPFEEVVQNLINSLDQGVGSRILRGFLALVLIVGLFSAYAWARFGGLTEPRAMEQAQLARTLVEKGAFETYCMRPADLDIGSGGGAVVPPIADVRNAPLPPLLTAAGMVLADTLTGTSVADDSTKCEWRVIVPLGILYSVATAFFVLLLASQLFEPRAGVIAMILYVVSDSVLSDSIAGLPGPLLSLLFVSAFLTALHAVRGDPAATQALRRSVNAAVSGVLTGLAFLTSYTAFVIVPALAGFLWFSDRPRRGPLTLIFLAAFAVTASPWVVRNMTVSERPLGLAPHASLNGTALYPADTYDRTLDPSPHRMQVAAALRQKTLQNITSLYDTDLRTLGSGIIICFFLVSFFHYFGAGEENRMRWALALAMALTMIVGALGGVDDVHPLRSFLPLIIVFGTGFFLAMLSEIEYFDLTWQALLTWILVLLTAIPAAVRIVSRDRINPYPPYHAPLVRYVSGLTGKTDVIGTDIPWATAWYGQRASVLLPARTDGLEALRERIPGLNAIYLARRTDPALSRDYRTSWERVREGRVPEGFPMTNGLAFPPGPRSQVFLMESQP